MPVHATMKYSYKSTFRELALLHAGYCDMSLRKHTCRQSRLLFYQPSLTVMVSWPLTFTTQFRHEKLPPSRKASARTLHGTAVSRTKSPRCRHCFDARYRRESISRQTPFYYVQHGRRTINHRCPAIETIPHLLLRQIRPRFSFLRYYDSAITPMILCCFDHPLTSHRRHPPITRSFQDRPLSWSSLHRLSPPKHSSLSSPSYGSGTLTMLICAGASGPAHHRYFGAFRHQF